MSRKGYRLRPCLQGGRATLVLGLPWQEGYPSSCIFLLFSPWRWGNPTWAPCLSARVTLARGLPYLACSAGVSFGRANVFTRESAMLKLPEEKRKWGESKGAGRGRGEREEFHPIASSLSKGDDDGSENVAKKMNLLFFKHNRLSSLMRE